MEHAPTAPFMQAIALKRHGHDVSGCDLDCGRLHHWESCRKCRELTSYAEDVLRWEDAIRKATRAERAKYRIPYVRELAWARRLLNHDEIA